MSRNWWARQGVGTIATLDQEMSRNQVGPISSQIQRDWKIMCHNLQNVLSHCSGFLRWQLDIADFSPQLSFCQKQISLVVRAEKTEAILWKVLEPFLQMFPGLILKTCCGVCGSDIKLKRMTCWSCSDQHRISLSLRDRSIFQLLPSNLKQRRQRRNSAILMQQLSLLGCWSELKMLCAQGEFADKCQVLLVLCRGNEPSKRSEFCW